MIYFIFTTFIFFAMTRLTFSQNIYSSLLICYFCSHAHHLVTWQEPDPQVCEDPPPGTRELSVTMSTGHRRLRDGVLAGEQLTVGCAMVNRRASARELGGCDRSPQAPWGVDIARYLLGQIG